MRYVVLAVTSLLVASCVPTPASYPVPPQHPQLSGPDPVYVLGFWRADDPKIDALVVKDIFGLEGNRLRWTGAEPELRIPPDSNVRRRLRWDIEVHDVTLKDTGPLRVSFYVNGRLAKDEVYKNPGRVNFEFLVPQQWLNATAENRISLSIANPWTAPSDGKKLGVLFAGAGLVD